MNRSENPLFAALAESSTELQNLINRSSEMPDCAQYEPYSDFRFGMVMFGSAFAITGGLTNTMLGCVLWKEANRDSPLMYLAVLAILDWWMCFSYILLFGCDAVAIYWAIEGLFDAWFIYILPLFSVCKIVQLLLPYIILAATLERFIISLNKANSCSIKNRDYTGPRLSFAPRALKWGGCMIRLRGFISFAWKTLSEKAGSVKGRKFIVGFIVSTVIAVRMPGFFEFRINQYPNCSDHFGTQEVWPRDFALTPLYQTWTNVTLPVIQYFIPFFLLLFLNVGIICNMYRMQRKRTKELSYEMSSFFKGPRKASHPLRKNAGPARHITNQKLSRNYIIENPLNNNHIPTGTDRRNYNNIGKFSVTDLTHSTEASPRFRAESLTQMDSSFHSNGLSKSESYASNFDSTSGKRDKTPSKLPLGIGLGMVRLASQQVKRRGQFAQEMKQATTTLVALVTGHLICSSLQVFIKILELQKSSILITSDGGGPRPTFFYTVATDAISFLVMFSSFLRIYIYLGCNQSIRRQLAQPFTYRLKEEEIVIFV